MARYQLLVFDWDGTLCDSIGRIVEAMQFAASEMDLPARSVQQVRDIIGLSLDEAILTLYPSLDEAAVEEVRGRYGDRYLFLERCVSPLFPGVREALDRFRQEGLLLAVATGKNRRGLDRVLHAHGWQDYFDVTRCADETVGKPDPRMLREILDHCRVPAERALMVGDSFFDLLMARAAGMDSVAVGHGAQPLSALQVYEPTLAIEKFSELPAWLDSRSTHEVGEHVG